MKIMGIQPLSILSRKVGVTGSVSSFPTEEMRDKRKDFDFDFDFALKGRGVVELVPSARKETGICNC